MLTFLGLHQSVVLGSFQQENTCREICDMYPPPTPPSNLAVNSTRAAYRDHTVRCRKAN